MSDVSEMISRAIEGFSNDGRLDVNELDQIVKIALADGVVDDEERKVLKSIIFNLTSKDLTPEMWTRVEELVAHYNLDQ
jgi:tellurite resistance protein